MESYDSLSAWLASRPKEIQELAKEFPIGGQVEVPDEGYWWIVGYGEGDRLLISPLRPDEDYDAAMNARQSVCAEHYRS